MVGLKEPRIRNRAHLGWVSTLPCVWCKCPAPSDPAHLPDKRSSAMSSKAPDNFVVSLCRSCHVRQHSIGHRKFWGGHLDKIVNIANQLYTISGQTDKALWMLLGWRS